MTELFGVDIAEIVNDALGSELRDGSLTKFTAGSRTGGSLTAGTNPTSASYAFKGFIEDIKEGYRGGQSTGQYLRAVSLLGASIESNMVPEIGDEITMDGETVKVSAIVERDPASALYVVAVEAR